MKRTITIIITVVCLITSIFCAVQAARNWNDVEILEVPNTPFSIPADWDKDRCQKELELGEKILPLIRKKCEIEGLSQEETDKIFTYISNATELLKERIAM